MTATELIYQAFGSPPVDTEPNSGRCMVCGKEITEGVPWKKVVGGSFTNWDEFMSPSSTHVCKECAVTLMTGDIATQLRRSSFIVTEQGVEFFPNSDLAAKIFNPPEPPFIFCVTFSFKKHNAFHSMISFSRDRYHIRQENQLIDIELDKARKLFAAMTRFYYGGFTKQEIQNEEYHPKRIMDFGLFKFEELETILSFERGSPLFELLIAALPSARREHYLKTLKDREKEGKRNASSSNGNKRKGGQVDLFGLEAH